MTFIDCDCPRNFINIVIYSKIIAFVHIDGIRGVVSTSSSHFYINWSTLYLKVTFIDCDCPRNFINIVIYSKIIAFVHIDGIRGVVSTSSSHFYINWSTLYLKVTFIDCDCPRNFINIVIYSKIIAFVHIDGIRGVVSTSLSHFYINWSTLYLKVTFIDCDCPRNFINIVIYSKIIAFVHIDRIRGVVSTPSSHFYINWSTLYLKVTFIDCDCTRNFVNIVIYPQIIAFVHIDGIRGVVSTPSSHFYIT